MTALSNPLNYEPINIIQLVAYGNVHELGWVRDRTHALEVLHELQHLGRLIEVVGDADQDKFLIINLLPPFGLDRFGMDPEPEVLMCTIETGIDGDGNRQYQWVDSTGLLPEHLRSQLRLQ